MIRITNFNCIITLVVFLFSFNVQSQSNHSAYELVVIFDPSATQSDIDFLLNYLNMEIIDGPTPHTKAYLLSAIDGVFPSWAYSDPISPINGAKKKAKSKSQTNGVGFNYFLKDSYFSSIGDHDICGPTTLNSWGSYPKKVTVLDTGLGDIPSLRKYVGSFAAGYDFVNQRMDYTDDNDHGTHITSIVVKHLPDNVVDLMAYKTHDHTGVGTTFNVIKGIDRSISLGVDVINMSFSFEESRQYRHDLKAPMYIAIEKAKDIGSILCVTSAGNNGTSNDWGLFSAYPASFLNDNIISVAAANCYTNRLAPWSNFGSSSVDVAASGLGISGQDRFGGDLYISGTSQAAAKVTNLAVQLGLYLNDFNYKRIKCAILNGAEPLAGQARILSGGVINAYNSFDIIENGGCPINLLSVQDDQNETSTKLDIEVSVDHALQLRATKAEKGIKVVEVYNSMGQRVYTSEEYFLEGRNSFSLPLDNLTISGFYVLVIRTEDSFDTISFFR